MIPWEKLGEAPAPGGGTLTLHRRGHEYSIRVDGKDLMGNRQHGSEDALAQLGCEGLKDVPRARVLIGGLGMGFSLRAALDVLRPDAKVEIAELVPAVVAWNRGPLSPLAGDPLHDKRVEVHEGDVVPRIAAARARYHAILLDVDNGPDALTSPGNARLYGAAGLHSAGTALIPGGTLAIWSAEDDARFTARLERAGFRVRVERVLARHNGTKRGGKRHVLWLAQRPV
ncbi:MAG: spermidine synthase [Polyangiales bacterium]